MQLEALVSTLGLPGLVIGSALEGEAVTFLGGAMAHRGLFPFEAAALAAATGAVLSDQTVFWAGRLFGRRAWVQQQLARGAVGRLRMRLEGSPDLFILGFRFIYGAKVLVWAHLWTAIGYGAGLAIERVFGRLPFHLHASMLVALVLAGSLAAFAWHRMRQGRGEV
jgi:membrane protein DedA with SNARE-associated domain